MATEEFRVPELHGYRDHDDPSLEKPIDMVLHCPNCHRQHIDQDEPWSACNANGGQGCRIGPHGPNGEKQCEFCGAPPRWVNRPHRSHKCAFCLDSRGWPFIWRPADVPTNGVAAIATRGKDDSPPTTPIQVSARGGNKSAEQATFRCVYCGAPSWVDPTDQRPPPDYCHEGDHGEPPVEE